MKFQTPYTAEELTQRLARVRHVALDMDGTIYMGSKLFPWTHKFLADLESNGIGYSFLTNNPSKSVDDYLAALAAMGIEAGRERIYTTTIAKAEDVAKVADIDLTDKDFWRAALQTIADQIDLFCQLVEEK